jgi:hypothetical protein
MTETLTPDHLRRTLHALEEQAAGFTLAELPVPYWLHQDIAWHRFQIETMERERT